MATLASRTGPKNSGDRVTSSDRFLLSLSLGFLALAVVGFAPTYWLQLLAGTTNLPPIIHLHGLVFTAWLTVSVAQTWLIVNGKLQRHRAVGLAAVAIGTLVVAVGLAAAASSLHASIAKGQGDAGRAFSLAMFSAVAGFGAFFAAALVLRRKRDWHSRLMIVATLFVLPPALGRLFFLAQFGMHPGFSPALLGPPPIGGRLLQASLILDCIVLLAMVRDWRVDGHVHRAWIWGLSTLLVVQIGRVPLSQSGLWFSTTDWLVRF